MTLVLCRKEPKMSSIRFVDALLMAQRSLARCLFVVSYLLEDG